MRPTLHCILQVQTTRPAGFASESESAYKLVTGLRAEQPRVSPTARRRRPDQRSLDAGESMAVVTSAWRKQPGEANIALYLQIHTTRPP